MLFFPYLAIFLKGIGHLSLVHLTPAQQNGSLMNVSKIKRSEGAQTQCPQDTKHPQIGKVAQRPSKVL